MMMMMSCSLAVFSWPAGPMRSSPFTVFVGSPKRTTNYTA